MAFPEMRSPGQGRAEAREIVVDSKEQTLG